MMEDLRELTAEAKAKGLAVVVWSYPRGGDLSKDGETAIDIVAYAAHMAALLGAHIIKVKLPSDYLEQGEAKKVYEKERSTSRPRRRASAMSCSPASTAGASSCSPAAPRRARTRSIRTPSAIRDGGGNGSIIGRNTFQRPREEALEMLDKIVNIYHGKVRHEAVAQAAE